MLPALITASQWAMSVVPKEIVD